MNKILKVSLAAVLTACPVAAFAAGEPLDSGTAPFAAAPTTNDDSAMVASTKYVKGAYNDVIGKINKVAETADAGQTETDVRNAINSAAGTTANTSLSASNGVLTVNVDGTHVTRTAAGALTLSSTDITNLGKAATALQSHQDISGKADKATTLAGYGITDAYTKTQVDTALSGKQDKIDSTHKLSGSLIADSSITATQLDSSLNSAVAKANSALQSTSNLDGSKLNTASVPESALATSVQNKLNSALTAANVDQTYSATSTNAQSGKAVAEAISTKQNTINADNRLNGAYISNGTVGTTQLSSGVNTSLGLADTALQAATAASTGVYNSATDYNPGTIGAAIKSAQSSATTAGNKIVPVVLNWGDSAPSGEVALRDPTIAG